MGRSGQLSKSLPKRVRILDSVSRNGKGKPAVPETQDALADVPF